MVSRVSCLHVVRMQMYDVVGLWRPICVQEMSIASLGALKLHALQISLSEDMK